jgi:hypothetical protein
MSRADNPGHPQARGGVAVGGGVVEVYMKESSQLQVTY